MQFKARWLLTISAITIAQVSSAQQRHDFGMQCTTGSFVACANVDLTVLHHGSDYVLPGAPYAFNEIITELRVRVSNPQGRPGFEYGPRGVRQIEFLGLTGFMDPRLWGYAFRTGIEGNVTLSDQTLGIGGLDYPYLRHTPNGRLAASFNYDLDAFLFGCDVPEGTGASVEYDATCGGAVIYSVFFLESDVWLTKDAAVTVMWRGWDDGATGVTDQHGNVGGWCTSGVDCVTVTPEPATLALTASGLAGIAAVRRRRKHTSD